jgi:DNA helicase IV
MRATTAEVPQAAANSGAAVRMRKYALSRLEQLSSEEKVAFGRIDHASGDKFYIGYHTIFDESGEVAVQPGWAG